MARMKKITMVNPEQITAKGWKGFKTRKAVENFATRYKVNHVWWRGPGNKKVMLVDIDHFREVRRQVNASKTSAKKSTRATSKSRSPKRIVRRTTVSARRTRTNTRRRTTRVATRRRAA